MDLDGSARSKDPRGMTAIGVFLAAAAMITLLAGVSLVWRGTPLDRMWNLNPAAHAQLQPWGGPAGILFILLSAALAGAATGWWKRRKWGWRLAVGIIAVQVLGDAANALLGRVVEGVTGATIAGALLFYLTRAPMRAAFEHHEL
jgi:hypothetical protein